MTSTHIQNKFIYGAVDLSFSLDAKSNVYKGSVKELRNFIIKQDGSIEVRPPLAISAGYTLDGENPVNSKNFYLLGADGGDIYYTYEEKLFSSDSKKEGIKLGLISFTQQGGAIRVDSIGDYVILSSIFSLETIFVQAIPPEFEGKVFDNIPKNLDLRNGEKKKWHHYEYEGRISSPALFNDRMWGFNYQHDSTQIIVSAVGAYYIQKGEDITTAGNPFKKSIKRDGVNKSAGFLNLEVSQVADGVFDLVEGFEFDIALYSPNDKVVWSVVNGAVLYFANSTGVYSIRPLNRNKVFSKANIKVVRESDTGSCNIDPIVHKNTLFYVGRDGRSIYMLSLERTDLTSNENINLTFLCGHLFKASLIKRIKIEKDTSVLWALLLNGDIVTITLNFTLNIMGASTQSFEGYHILDIIGSDKIEFAAVSTPKEIQINGKLTENFQGKWGMGSLKWPEPVAAKNKDGGKHPYTAKIVTNNFLLDREDGAFLFGYEVTAEEIGLLLRSEELGAITKCVVNKKEISFKIEGKRNDLQLDRKRICTPIICGTELIYSLELRCDTTFAVHGLYTLYQIESKNL